MHTRFGMFLFLALLGCSKAAPSPSPASSTPPTAAPAALPSTPPQAPQPSTEPAATTGAGAALATAKSLEIAHTNFGSTPGATRTETDPTTLAAFVHAVGEAPLTGRLRKCPDTIVVTARDGQGAVVATLGFCGSGDNLAEGAEAVLPGRARGGIALADATAIHGLLARR